METAIYNISGKETGKKALLMVEIFGIEPNDHRHLSRCKAISGYRRQGPTNRNNVTSCRIRPVSSKDKKVRVELVG